MNEIKIATVLFTYNRSRHTRQVLEALAGNTELPKKLIIFQDGLKREEHREEWEKVNKLIGEFGFCPTELIVSCKNKGLAQSIVEGVNWAFEEYDAVIVLEDDCVPMPGFIGFMRQNFEKYINKKKVYCISGYSWPIAVEKNTQEDAYFCGRFCSWGWGTWKDRWTQYEQNYNIVAELIREQDGSRQIAIWGNDLEGMLLDRVRGRNDSWAVFWALRVIAQRGLCVNPYRSLIQNIGMDGTGVHCGTTEEYNVCVDKRRKKTFILPEQMEVSDVVERKFSRFYHNYTVKNEKTSDKLSVLIYGMGALFFEMERKINEKFYIEGFLDANKSGYYAGRPIKKISEINSFYFDKIVICMNDRDEGIRCARYMIKEYGICFDEIVFAQEIKNI